MFVRRASVHTFAFFIEDDRYSVPTVEFVTAGDIARAKELALIKLRGSPHHLSIEVLEDDRLVFRLPWTADRRDERDNSVHG
jgi:hypothetical protein